MSRWNDSAEHIMSLQEHNGLTLAITIKEKPYLEIGCPSQKEKIRQEVTFKGYILEHELSKNHPRRFVSMRCFIHYRNDYDKLCRNHMWIDDFTMIPDERNKGYGSLILKRVILYAKQNKMEYISGELSVFDTAPQHGNRGEMLHHFYKKHGFTIDENDRLCYNLKNYN